MEKFIIDTNYFINLEIKSGFGNNPKEVIENFTDVAKKLKQEKKGDFFMPPSAIEELKSFFNQENFIKDLFSVITIKSPDLSNIQFSARIFYQLIDEVRGRSYRGLRIAEESVMAGAKEMNGVEKLNKIGLEKRTGRTIKNLRERYRQATRYNFLDSVADLDLIVLTREIDGLLISSDEGVIRWGRIFGVKEVFPSLFRERLFSLLTRK
jgi:RNA ligase partner protein